MSDPVKKFVEMGKALGEITQLKNEAYGDSFKKAGDVFRILYPDGILPEQYDDMLAQARILDKQFRIATRKDAFGESPYRDIAGYGILGAVADEEKMPPVYGRQEFRAVPESKFLEPVWMPEVP